MSALLVVRSGAKVQSVLVRLLAVVGLAALYAAAPAIATQTRLRPVSAATPIERESAREGQWQIDRLRVPSAWKVSTGSGVIVAVIDSGVAADHPDLKGRVLPGIDLVDRGGDGTADAVGHGTTVAGLIVGHGPEGGARGIAPDAKILPVRVLDAENRYRDSKVVAEGIVWAVDHGANVINLSLGGGVISSVLAEAIDYAFASDVVVVACAGNVLTNGPSNVWHPASEPGVIAVTAIAEGGRLWRGSLTGPEVVLAAPGSDLVGAKPGGYQRVQGTSFAAPMVAATAALVRSEYPTMSAANVVQRLIMTARDAGVPGRDDRYGFGIVDPYAALTAPVPTVVDNPLDKTPPPGASGFGSALTEASVLPPIPGVRPYSQSAPAMGPIPTAYR